MVLKNKDSPSRRVCSVAPSGMVGKASFFEASVEPVAPNVASRMGPSLNYIFLRACPHPFEMLQNEDP